MRTKTWLAVVVLAWLAAEADAHFVLVSPAPSIVQNRLGDPQKVAPCGGVSANPGRGTPANPGVPSGVVTDIKGGSSFHVLLSETVFHPGHYRVALAKSAANLPPDPKVTTRDSDRGPWSVSAEIQSPALPALRLGLGGVPGYSRDRKQALGPISRPLPSLPTAPSR